MKYEMIGICGKAGSGKDTIMRKVVSNNPSLHEIVSCTTRPMREGEAEGINYFFLTGEQFGDKVVNGEMLEATCFNDWFYGTSYDSLRSDCVNIGVFNPEGIDSIIAHKDIELVVFLIEADDKIRLLRQLNREEHPDVHEIIRRFKADELDFEDLDFHHNVLINDSESDLDYCVKVVGAAAKTLQARLEQSNK